MSIDAPPTIGPNGIKVSTFSAALITNPTFISVENRWQISIITSFATCDVNLVLVTYGTWVLFSAVYDTLNTDSIVPNITKRIVHLDSHRYGNSNVVRQRTFLLTSTYVSSPCVV